MPFLGGLIGKVFGAQPGQGLGDKLGAAAAFGQGAMGGRGLLGALGGGILGARQWQQQHPWAPPSAPTMQPFTPSQLPGPVAMPQVNPGVGQMPMPNLPPQVNPGVGMMPQYRNLGFGPMRWS